MIDKVAGTIRILDQTQKIERFEVWFQTPFGLMDDFEDAKQRVLSADFEIAPNVIPVSVAVGATLYEVCGQ